MPVLQAREPLESLDLAPAPTTATAPILVVDDSPVDRHLASGLVSRTPGFHAVAARGGREALEAIAASPPAAVVTDLQMPGMDGLELVGEIRRLRPEIPVILMTAHGSEEIAIRALRAGAANYVPKRLLASDLAPTLRSVLALAGLDCRRRRVLGESTRCSRSLSLENDPALVPVLVEILQEDLGCLNTCDETALTRAGVALTEAISNALYHGNLEVSSDLRQEDERVFYAEAEARRRLAPYASRRILVRSEIGREAARFVVRDEGPGFDTATLDAPFDPESLTRIGGRGLILIRAFMDEVRHNAQGNEITLVLRRAASPRDEP